MEHMIFLDLRLLGLMGTLNGQHLNTAVYEEGPHYTRLSSDIPGYHEDAHIRPFHRRERAKKRRAEECRWPR
jgi:hypothetical protein